jgi:hypothetical protein
LKFLRALLLLFVIGLPIGSIAQAIAVRDLAVLVDVAGTETIATASAPNASKGYAMLAGSLSAGYTHNVHWLYHPGAHGWRMVARGSTAFS